MKALAAILALVLAGCAKPRPISTPLPTASTVPAEAVRERVVERVRTVTVQSEATRAALADAQARADELQAHIAEDLKPTVALLRASLDKAQVENNMAVAELAAVASDLEAQRKAHGELREEMTREREAWQRAAVAMREAVEAAQRDAQKEREAKERAMREAEEDRERLAEWRRRGRVLMAGLSLAAAFILFRAASFIPLAWRIGISASAGVAVFALLYRSL